jgi:hypothetical protein
MLTPVMCHLSVIHFGCAQMYPLALCIALYDFAPAMRPDIRNSWGLH